MNRILCLGKGEWTARDSRRLVRVIQCGLVSAATFWLSGCRIDITVPAVGGTIETAEGLPTCVSGTTCSQFVSYTSFDETYVAIPDAGYDFVGWKKRNRSFCGGSTKPCRLTTTGFEGNADLMAVLQSDEVFYLEPVFEKKPSSGLVPLVSLFALRAGADGFHLARGYGDFNGDGFLDIFIAPGNSNTRMPLELYLNDGHDDYVLDNRLLVDPAAGGIHPRKAVVADFNGDGKDDVIIADHGRDTAPFPGASPILLLSTPRGLEPAPGLDTIVGFLHSVAVGDVDRDGDMDAFFTNSSGKLFFLINDGKGRMRYDTSLTPTGTDNRGYFTSELVDLDRDGFLDLLIAGHEFEGNPTTIYWGSATPGFKNAAKTVLPAMSGGHGVVLDIDVADINGDGSNDIVLNRAGSPPEHQFYGLKGLAIQVLQGQGRNFRDVSTSAIDVTSLRNQASWVAWLRLEDRNGDSYPDLVVDDDWIFDSRFVYLNDGKGKFTEQQ